MLNDKIKLFDNISLRLLQFDDAKDIYNTIDSQRDYLGRWLPFVKLTTGMEFTQKFVDYAIDAEDKTYTIRKDDKFIGLIGFKATDKENHKTEIGYWLSQDQQGQGIITRILDRLCQYAFKELSINRIQVKCATGNIQSSNIPKRLGFTFEGIERAGELFPDGSYVDLEIYSIVKEDFVIETDRLILRKLVQADFNNLRKILQNEKVMYAYEGVFDDEEVQEWLLRQINRYKNDGIGLYAVILKKSGEFIGQCGLTMQDYNNNKVMEVGYLFRSEFWHHGYATEAAIACREYAFNKLGVSEVYSIIRDTNIDSKKVAKRNGMELIDQYVKHFRHIDMPHFVYVAKNKIMQINPQRTENLVKNLTKLWESSVRASHHFLLEDDIVKLAPFVKLGLDTIETLVIKCKNNTPIAFMGIENHKIEMLFIAPNLFGRGIGRELVELALNKFRVAYVDVNEQNTRAVEFYKHIGFNVFKRTEFDEQGNPFPILKMKFE